MAMMQQQQPGAVVIQGHRSRWAAHAGDSEDLGALEGLELGTLGLSSSRAIAAGGLLMRASLRIWVH